MLAGCEESVEVTRASASGVVVMPRGAWSAEEGACGSVDIVDDLMVLEEK